MSTWIYITNLPLYYDDISLQDIFNGIGEIITTKISQDELLLKSTAIIQFSDSKHAKLAASKKDGTVIDKSAIRVFIIWCNNEDLSSIKVSNILPDSTIQDLDNTFNPYGNIVNISKDINNEYALISYSKVDYALQATQEMNHNIIGSDHQLSVTLMNPDARNLQWKRHTFEYIALNGKPKRYIATKNDTKQYEIENEIESDTDTEYEYEYEYEYENENDNDTFIICNELLVYGYIRCNIFSMIVLDNISLDIICAICNIGLCYFGLYNINKQPLYLRNPLIPAPPQRLPPSPPGTDVGVTINTIQKDSKSISDIEGKYQQIFDIYRDRLDLIENRMSVLSSELDNVSLTMKGTLVGLENRRINDINTIQKQFNNTITALCYQINNQINNQIIKITQKMEQCRNTNNERMETVENKIQILKNENDVLRKQNKINKILKIQSKTNENIPNNINYNTQITEEEKLKNWLFDIVKLPQYLTILINNGYDDLETISDITFDELQQIGIKKMGHRKKIIKYAQKINHNMNIKYNHNHSKSAMSPNSANSSLLYTSHNIWSDDSVNSIPWNTFSQGSNNTNNNNKNQIE